MYQFGLAAVIIVLIDFLAIFAYATLFWKKSGDSSSNSILDQNFGVIEEITSRTLMGESIILASESLAGEKLNKMKKQEKKQHKEGYENSRKEIEVQTENEINLAKSSNKETKTIKSIQIEETKEKDILAQQPFSQQSQAKKLDIKELSSSENERTSKSRSGKNNQEANKEGSSSLAQASKKSDLPVILAEETQKSDQRVKQQLPAFIL